MKETKINQYELEEAEDSRLFILAKLREAGFDLNRNWTQHLECLTNELVFRQQE